MQGRNELGFTLVELMVVLVIVGLVSTAVVLAMPDPQGGLTNEAQRFAARAKAAQERAIMDNRAYALRLTPQGYGFERSVKGEWRGVEERPFVTTPWRKGTEMSAPDGRIVFDPTGLAEPSEVVLARGGDRIAVTVDQGGGIHVRR
jgi:general secretion pathway protein H